MPIKPICQSPSSREHREKIWQKAHVLRLGERDHLYHHGQNRLDLRNLVLFIVHLQQCRIWRNKNKTKKTFPPISPPFQAQFHSQHFYIPSPSSVGDGEWGSQSGHKGLSIPRFPPHALPLLHCGGPSEMYYCKGATSVTNGLSFGQQKVCLELALPDLGAAPDFSYHKPSLPSKFYHVNPVHLFQDIT